MRICEIYSSIIGEGLFLGRLATFIRLANCNLYCHDCDSKFARVDSFVAEDGVLLTQVKANKNENIVITGGEPLLQWIDLKKFIDQLDYKYEIHLETNGTFMVNPAEDLACFDSIAVSPKLQSAQVDMDPYEFMIWWTWLARNLAGKTKVYFKFAVDNHADRMQLCSLFEKLGDKLYVTPILLQPQTNNSAWKEEFKSTIEWIKNDGLPRHFDIRLMPRWQTVLWGNERGK